MALSVLDTFSSGYFQVVVPRTKRLKLDMWTSHKYEVIFWPLIGHFNNTSQGPNTMLLPKFLCDFFYRDSRILPCVVGVQVFLQLQRAELHLLQEAVRHDLKSRGKARFHNRADGSLACVELTVSASMYMVGQSEQVVSI